MTEIVKRSYAKLVKDLKALMEEGQRLALEAANKIRVETYWRMGKRIVEDESGLPAGKSGEASLTQLADDLQIEVTLLSRIVKFFKLYPKLCAGAQSAQLLSWAHYAELMTISDDEERDFYLKETLKNNWGRDKLRQMIYDDLYFKPKTAKTQKKSKGAKLERRDDQLYLYSSEVRRVVDGDTLLLRVDLGFDVHFDQRVRLRGIDCPEISTEEGERAKEFVQNELSNCEVVVVQTFKRIDIYGRYVCDLFYLPHETDKEKIAVKGEFLNQRLLNAGLAKLF